MQSPETSPELEKLKQDIEAIPDTPQIPEHIEKGGVVPTQSQFTAQVTDDKGNPVINAVQTTAGIKIPKSESELKKSAKGSITEAATWFARFWLRMIKKITPFKQKEEIEE